jgi:Uncharacterized protein conserved in bacteria (DUF2188)
MSRVTYEVLPLGAEWLVRLAADSQWELLPTRADAVRRARELGGRYGDWRVRVLSENGTLEEELSSQHAHA